MVITFDRSMIIPDDYSSFNSSVLTLEVQPGADSNPNDLTFSWTITDFTYTTMTIQINFDHPEAVSSNFVRPKQINLTSYRMKM
jgi:hypothetical protein